MQQCSQHVYMSTITAAMPHQASLEVENNVLQRAVKRQCQGKTGVGATRDAGKASSSPRWAAELTPSHILDTHNHPLSDFEEALLVQALLSHGNKWLFIAAQYMPWRAPTDLRTACHAKPTAGLAAHNRYIQQGCSMSWLLANTTPEYRAHWEKYNNHQRAVTQAKVAAATSYGINKQASLPKAPPKGAGATRLQQRSAPVSDISSMLTGSDISAASDAGSQATHAQKESSTATVSATCADPSPIQLSDPGCDDATNVFDAAAQHAAATPGAASAWPQPAAAATSAAAAATLPAGQLGVPEPQGILSQGLTGNMQPAVWGMGFGAPSQQGAGMLSALAMNAGGWPAQVTSAPLGCAPMFSAPVGLGFSTGANMAYSAQCPPKQQTQHGGNTVVLQGPNPVPPAVSAPAAAAVAAGRATGGAQLQGAAVGRSRKRSADGIVQGARGAAGFRSSPLQPSDTAQGVQGGYAAAGTGALTGQSPQVSAGAASAGAGTAGAGAATQAGAGATGALQAVQPEEDDPFSFLESMPSYEVPAWIEEAAEQAANAALAARGPSSTDAGAAQAPAAAPGNDNAACAGQTTKASQESSAHAQGSQHSPCVGLQAPGMGSAGYKTPRSVLPTSSSCKSLASAGSREDCMRNADAAAVPAAATKRPESSMHTGSQDGDHTVLEGVLPGRQSVPAAAAGLQDHGVTPHAPAAAVAQRHSWMTDMPAQRQFAQTALQDSSQAQTSGSHGAGQFVLGDGPTVAHAANAVSTLQHNMRYSRPTVLGAAKSQGGAARAASAAQHPSGMRNSTDGVLAAAQAGAMLQNERSLHSSRDSALGAVQAGSVQQNNSSTCGSRDGALGSAHAQGGVQNINSMRRSRDGALGAARADNAVVQAGATLQDCSDMRSSRDSAVPGVQAQDAALQAGPMLQNSSMHSSRDDALGGAQAHGAPAQALPVPEDSTMRSSHDAVLGIAPTQSDAALQVPAVHGGSQHHSSSCFGHAAWDGVPQHSHAPGVQEGSMMHTGSYGPDHTTLDSTTAQQHAEHASAQPNYGMHSGSYRAMHSQQAHMHASRHAAPTAAGLQDACNSSGGGMHSKAQHGQVGLLMQEERSLLHSAYGSGSFASCSGTATGGSAATAYSPNTSVTPSSADASGTVFNPKSHGPAETAGHGAEAVGMPAAAPAATMAPPAAVVPAASSALGLHPSTWGGTGVGLHRESNLSRATGGQFAPRMGAQAPKAVPAAAAGGDSCRQGSHKQTQQQKQQRELNQQQALPGQQQLQAPTAMPAAAAHDTVRGSSDQSQQQQWVLQQQQVWPNHQQQLQPPHAMPAAAAGLDSGGSNGKPQQQQWEVEQQQACPGQQQQQQQQSVPQQQQQAPQQQQQSLQQQLLKNQQRQQRTTLPQAHTQQGRRQQLPEQQQRPKQPLPQQQAGQLAPAGAAATSSQQQQLEQQSLHGQQPDQTHLWPQYMPGQAWLLDMQQQQQQQDMAQLAWQQQHVQLQQHQHQHQQGLHQDSISQQASLLQQQQLQQQQCQSDSQQPQQLQQHGGDRSDPQLGEDNTIAEDPNSFSGQLQQLLVSNSKDIVVTAAQQPKPAGQGKNSTSEGAVDAAQKQAKPKAHAAQPRGGSAVPGAPSLPGATAAEAAAAKVPRVSAAPPIVGAALAQYQPASAGFSSMPFGQAAAGGAVSASAPVSAAPAQYQPASAGLPSMPTGQSATAIGAAVSAAPMQQHQPASTGLPSMSAGQSAAAAVGGRTQSLPADLSKPAKPATAARGFARVVGFSRAQAQARAAAAAAAAAAAGGGGLDATATSHPRRRDKGTYGMLAPSFGQQYESQLGATAPRAPWQAAAAAPVPAAPSSAAPWQLSAMSATPTSAAGPAYGGVGNAVLAQQQQQIPTSSAAAAADTAAAKAAAAAAATAAASAAAELDGGWGQMHLTADDGDVAGWGAELQHSQQPPQQQQQQVPGVPSCLAAAATAAAKNLQLLQQQRFPRFSSMPEPGYMAAPDVYQHMPSFAAAGEAAAIDSSWPQLQQYSSLPSGVGFGTAAVQTGSWHALQEQAHFAATAANGVGGAAGIHAAAEVLGQQQRRQQAHAPSPEVASTAAGDSGSSQRLPQLSSQTSAAAAAAAAAAHDAAKTKQQQLGGSGPVAAAPVTRSAARQADGSAEAQQQQLPGASLSAAGAIAARRRTAADKQHQRQQEQEQQEALQPAEPAAPDALARRQAAARPMQQAEPSAAAAAAAAGDPAAAAAAVDPAAAAAAPVAELPVFAAAALGAGRKSRPGTNGGLQQKVQQPVQRARPAPASPATAAAAAAAAAHSPAMRVSSVQTQQQQQPQHKAAAAAGRSPAVAVSRVQTQQQQQHQQLCAAAAAARSPAVGVSNVQKQQPQQQPLQHHAAGAAAARSPAAGVSSIQKQQPQQQQTQHHHAAAGAPSAAAAAGPTGGELAAMLNGVHTAQQTVQVPYSVEDMSGVVPSTDAAALNAALDVFFGNAVDGADDEDFDLAGLFPDL